MFSVAPVAPRLWWHNIYKVMHTHQFFTWSLDNTHCREHNSTRLQKLYTYMCNIVTEFYLYSIVYIYLISSRLDVTHSVHHHFCTIQTLSWCQTSGKSREEFTVIELTHTQHFKRLFERTLNIQTSSETIRYDHSILEM